MRIESEDQRKIDTFIPIKSEDQRKINAVLKAKRGQGWEKANAPQALKKASIIYFKLLINYPSLELVKDQYLIDKKTLIKEISNFFTDNNQGIINNFINQNYDRFQSKIPVNSIIELISSQSIHLSGISQRSYRDFLEQKLDKIEIFNVYITLFRTTYYELDKNNTIEKGLKSFNHDDQVYFLKQTLKNNILQKIFLNINSCPISRNWLFIRLEKVLQELRGLEVEQFDLGKMSYAKINLRENFHSKYPNLLRQLQTKSIVLGLNVDNYNLDRFNKEIINDFWLPILKKINSCQTNGYLVLFIYRTTDWSENYDFLNNYLVKIKPANPYQYQDLNDLLINLSTKFNYQINNPLLLAQDLLQQYGNQPEKILQMIYQTFNCNDSNLKQLWINRYS